MASKERENFYKNSTLIVDHAKDSLVDVLELHVHLSIKSPSFENFINLHRHEIYHLCFNKRRCCQCLPGYVLPVNRVLYPSQLKILLDTYHGVARTCQCPGRRTDVCCCLNVAKPGVTTNVLDITLARCLLINFCDDVFWHSCLTLRSNTLEDFLNQNQHHLYHLANVSTSCCRCPPGYVLPVARPLLDLHQWNVLFNVHALLPCALHRNIPGSNICWVLASSGIDVNNLSKDLSSTILEQCCSLRKNIDTLLQMRNNVYGHAKEGRITDVKYRIDKNEIESAILEIAKVCGNETEKKQILMDLEKRSLDETLCIQYQNTMLDQIAKDTQLEEKLNDLAEKIPEIVEKAVVKAYGNTEQELTKALIKKPLQDVCCVEGEIACLSCEIIKDETAVTWYKDDVEIIPSTDIILKMHGKIHELSIPRTEMKDGGRYSIKVKQSTSEAKLTVKALISNHLVDITCLEGSNVVLSCEVSVEDISGIWYKDDSIVVQSNQIYPTVKSRIHQHIIFQSEIKDGGKYVFKIRDKMSSAILTVKAVITKHLENVTRIEDQSLSLVCELAEKDISVIWLKDEKVIEASKNIVPEIHDNAHILKFKKLSKNDGGKYALMARGKKTEAVVLVIAKSTIPDQILQMDEKDKEMYLEIIMSGTERRYYIRLMIVGENGVGKTCLMRRLFGENIDDVTSTDGIDVVIRKCKIRLSDGQWILNEEDTVKQDRNVRMKRALTDKDSILPEEKIRDKQAEDDPMETTVTPFGNVKGEEIKNVTEIKDIYTGKVMDQKNDVDMQFTNELKEESIAESVPLHTDKDVALKSEKRVELSDTLSDAMNVELTKDIFADCNVWDFAGQKEFYATHQTFLTNSAIYLLTADLSKDLSSQSQIKICDVEFDKIGCYIDFWFDTIHCYATTESPDQSVDKPMSDKLEPPIIIVCTGTDKIKGELSEQKSLFRRQLNSILSRQITYKHVRYIQYLSNKEPLEKDFLELQSTIFKTATEMSSWGKELPLRWIHLETALDGERDAGSNILPFDLVVKLAKESSLPTSDNEEIILFLRYQHECGHVIFFKDLPDYIILNPRWLIDVFKCFVSADQFMGDLLNVDDWEELKETGKLSNTLISMLFEKVSTLKLMKYKEHVLRVLEKFDIIVKPTVENMTSKLYYMPCMIKPRSFKEMRDRFHVDEQSCRRTSWLLLEFEFLPPAFFNHVLVGCIRKFNVNIETGRRLSLYRGISVFDIDKLGNRKLVICAQKNLIAFQIWIYDHELLGTFHNFRQTLTNMVDMLSERYQICSKYKVKLKCSESDYKEEEGRFELKDLQDDKTYYCPEHGIAHACLDVYEYWFSDKYPEGDLEAQAKEEEEAGEVTKKEKQKRDDNDSSPSGTPEKKKLVDPDQLKLIKEDEGNKILWNEAKEFTKEGAQEPEKKPEPMKTPAPPKVPQAVEELNVVDIHGKTSFTGRAKKKAEGQAEWKDKSERINRVKLFVNNLNRNIDDERLRKEFSQFGTIPSAKVEIKDGGSKGFGYVCFSSPEEATKAITEMDGRTVDGKALYVALHQRKEDRKAHLASQYMERTASIRMQVDGLAIKEEEQEGAARTALLDDNASSFKQARAKQEDESTPGMRKTMSASKGLNRDHFFISKTVIKPETCTLCGKRIGFGRMAMKCKDCKASCHPHCKDSLPLPCRPTAPNTPGGAKLTGGLLSDYTPMYPPYIPGIIVHCVNEVEARGLTEIGLYRVPGSDSKVKELKEDFFKGKGILNLSHIDDIHVVCGCIKDFLRGLKESLVTYALWKDFVHAAENRDKCMGESEIYQAISKLPTANRDTLAFLILHLIRVSECKECKMPSNNLAKVFGPIVIGYSFPDPEPLQIINETKYQAMVMNKFFEIPESYWEKFLNIDEENLYSNTYNTPQTPDGKTAPKSYLGPIHTPETYEHKSKTWGKNAMTPKKEDSNMLYRLLRPDESWRDGLCAKNPHSTTSVFDYVIKGRNGTPSKYISTCGSWKAVNSFRSKSTDPGRIANIQKDKLPSSVEIIDLRLQENRDHYIDNDEDKDSIGKFNNFAKIFEVVLLVGHVPEACIELCDD